MLKWFVNFSPPRFWTFFIRQKMGLLFLKKKRGSPHLLRERRNTSVPLFQMLLAVYLLHFSC